MKHTYNIAFMQFNIESLLISHFQGRVYVVMSLRTIYHCMNTRTSPTMESRLVSNRITWQNGPAMHNGCWLFC